MNSCEDYRGMGRMQSNGMRMRSPCTREETCVIDSYRFNGKVQECALDEE